MARNGRILLCKGIKLDRNYRNVLNYSESQMLELCSQNIVAQAEDYSFIRDKGSIKVGFNYDTVLSCNYIAFENPDYAGKWFFAFIDKVNFISPGATEIEYTIDIWSTWFSYWVQMPCFVSREHVNDDTIGLHTVPENIDVGEVIQESIDEFSSLADGYYICIMCTYDLIVNRDVTEPIYVNNILFSSIPYFFEVGLSGETIDIQHFIEAVIEGSTFEAIKNIFIVPKALIDSIGITNYTDTIGGATFNYYKFTNDSYINEEYPFIFEKTTSFSDYTPKNNKCFVYPYNYLYVTNNMGNNNIFKYEDFYTSSGQCEFLVEACFQIGCSIRLVPRQYKKLDKNIDEAIPLSKYPTCELAGDSYTNWLTQNAVNVGSQILGTVASVATGNVAGVAGNIANLIGGFYQGNLLPSLQKGQNEGDINYSTNSNKFVAYHMRVKTEYLKIIDNFFSRFGYKINETKMANLTGRKNYNYVEIGQDETLAYTNTQKNTGSIPSNALETINNCFRSGVTIWHNHENLGNFNVDNGIV